MSSEGRSRVTIKAIFFRWPIALPYIAKYGPKIIDLMPYLAQPLPVADHFLPHRIAAILAFSRCGGVITDRNTVDTFGFDKRAQTHHHMPD